MPRSAQHFPIDDSVFVSSRELIKPAYRWCQLMLGVMVLLSFTSGCQTFHPFAKKTREKFASARQWANNGLEAFQNGHLDQAKGLFSRASQQNPTDYRIRANLAKTLYQSGDPEQAIAEMIQAVELSGNEPKTLITLGQMYLGLGELNLAQEQVELALAPNHRYAPAWELKGKISKSKGDYQNALADFQKSLGFEPDVTNVQLEIVDTYQRMGEPLRALSAVEQVLQKNPIDKQLVSTIVAKSAALIELKQLRPAIDLLETASHRPEASSDLFLRLGNAQLLAGDRVGARTTVERGQRAFPNLPVFDELAQSFLPEPQRQVADQNVQTNLQRY